MLLTHENLSLANLRNCDWIALGVARRILEQFGHSMEGFIAAHPELICPFIPAVQFRNVLVSGE